MHTCSLARSPCGVPSFPVSPYSPTVPNGCLGLRPSW
ncbi:unnamed protein product [Acanthoscelides obtectus]|uniref:Uncharacterized protein n=1 Tax=Acanthoscelides obtectus TaxID=200917 RepID=A0A9P0K6Z4_ACAOB|nr:unnamed protein product [Acanthoscelides obtectus]CAK1666518.1 hypothetical protein AOBTE_LOCUS25358 [Acanthoscelides obtectus]